MFFDVKLQLYKYSIHTYDDRIRWVVIENQSVENLNLSVENYLP